MKFVLYSVLAGTIVLAGGLAFRAPAVRQALPAVKGGSFSVLFLLYGLVAIPSMAVLMPPYQVSDEAAHFARADQVSLGHPIGYRSGTQSGGIIDSGVGASFSAFYPIILHPEVKTTKAIADRAEAIDWSGEEDFFPFENTSIYPPFFYTLSALGIAAGKAMNMSVVSTLILSRLLNGVAALGLGALAIGLAGPAAPWFFAVLTLPMTLSQMASVSQDALLFPTAALAAGLFIRLLRDDVADLGDLALLCLLLALISTGRITYAALALLPLTLGHMPLIPRLLGAAAIAATAAAWSSLASAFALIQFGLHGADAAGQIRHLLAEPSSILAVAVNTMKYQYDLYLESFVGKLGWLDLRLPESYHRLAWIDLVVALAISAAVFGWRGRGLAAATTLVALLASVGALFAALYISWTPVGNVIVDGVQGRYFIPLAFFLPALLPIGAGPPPGWPGRIGGTVVALFPLMTIPVVLTAIVGRYYLG